MRKPFKTKTLPLIFSEERDLDLILELNKFVLHKKHDLEQPLTEAETTFYLVHHLGSEIVCDGWSSVFMQAYTFSELQCLIGVFRSAIPLPSLADRLERARAIYYLGRTDLDRPDKLWVDNDTFAHLTEGQYDEMLALGEGVDDEGGELLQMEPLLAKWCRQHRDGFVETKAEQITPPNEGER